MKETRKNVLDIESGIKNLSEEQVKEQFHPFVESVARRQKQNGNPLPMEELIPLGEEGLLKFGLFGKQWKKNLPNNGTISCICQKFIVTLQRFCCNK